MFALVPTEAPLNFKEVDRTSSEMYITWEPPNENSWNGELLGYKVSTTYSSKCIHTLYHL